MTIQEQVYDAIQSKMSRLCRAEYLAAPKNKRGGLKKPLTYSVEVDRLVELGREILDMNDSDAENAMYEITHGGIDYKILQSK